MRREVILHGLHPVAQGSLRALPGRGKARGRTVLPQSKELLAWREAIRMKALACDAGPPVDEPVSVLVTFWLKRPASVSSQKRKLPHRRPDLDKLVRAVLDALTGVWLKDDSLVVNLIAKKRYAPTPTLVGVRIEVAPVETGPHA